MPIYEYECPDCGGRFEALQKMGEETAPCPQCGGRGEKVLASSFGVIASGRARSATGRIPVAAAQSRATTSLAPEERC